MKMDLKINVIVILLQHVLVGLIGCIGNVFVLVVYLKRLKDNEISTLFILYLAITDLTCCLLLMPINCFIEMSDLKTSSDFLCKFHTFLIISNITYSCFLMTLVAVERYFSIIWPLHTIINKSRAKYLAFILFILCLFVAVLGSLGVGIYHKGTIFNDIESSKNISNGSVLDESYSFNHYKNLSENTSYSWERTDECFHNDLIINRKAFAIISLIQNSLPVICFFIIFILYAIIYISVVKRRRMKQDRDIYYNKIVTRSKQFTKVIETKGINGKQPYLDPLNCNNNNNNSDNASNTSLNNLYVKSSPKSPNLIIQYSFEKSSINMDSIDFYNRKNSKEFIKTKDSEEEMSKMIPKNRIPKKNLDLDDSPKKMKNIVADSVTDISHVSPGHDKPLNGCIENTKIQILNNNNNTSLNNNILMANIKTAFMLFIVTLIMAIVFTPALLISFGAIEYNPIYWNLFFISNAGNPIVYSFLNENFRNSLKIVLCSTLVKNQRNIRKP
jgi:hypothetical protein